MKKTAVILFNLGGPDSLDAVEPFLFNLFRDPAIIGLPGLPGYCVARLISWHRVPIAKRIYEKIGGRSPLLAITRSQASALDARLNDDRNDTGFKSFIVMRHWHPMSDEVAVRVKEFDPDQVILMPLYPQYSSTTTGSSIADWHRAAQAVGLRAPTQAICCYPDNEDWIAAQGELVAEHLARLKSGGNIRLLFSAHGLPAKIIRKGDPYQHQVEMTAAALARVIERSGVYETTEKPDWSLCYQSRVGRLEWIGPSTVDEITRAGRDGKNVVVVPIAFVSENSETLVELDMEYRDLAARCGISDYTRVATAGVHDRFINGLAGLVQGGLCRLGQEGNIASQSGRRICPLESVQCPLNPQTQG